MSPVRGPYNLPLSLYLCLLCTDRTANNNVLFAVVSVYPLWLSADNES